MIRCRRDAESFWCIEGTVFGRLLPLAKGSSRPIAAGGDRQYSAESVKKLAMVFALEKHTSEIEIITFEKVAGLRFHVAGS